MVEGDVEEAVEPAPPAMPKLRWSLLAFVLGGLVVTVWSLAYQFNPRPDVEPSIINDVNATLQAP